MITFLSILFALLGLNVFLLIFSVNKANARAKDTKSVSESKLTKIFPLRFLKRNIKKPFSFLFLEHETNAPRFFGRRFWKCLPLSFIF